MRNFNNKNMLKIVNLMISKVGTIHAVRELLRGNNSKSFQQNKSTNTVEFDRNWGEPMWFEYSRAGFVREARLCLVRELLVMKFGISYGYATWLIRSL